jgi:prepilin-type N-terminal cleavage/methylation domain-containing protein
VTWRAEAERDAGVTLVELLIVMVLMSVIGAITVTAVTNAARSQARISDDAQGLQDVQTVTERLGRDLRQARGVDSTATAYQLTIWIDKNSDFVQTPDETVTWCLRSTSGCVVGAAAGTHYNVVRFTADAPAVQQVVGRTVVDQLAFTYSAAPVQTSTLVSVKMTYDATGFAGKRNVEFRTRMRNVP